MISPSIQKQVKELINQLHDNIQDDDIEEFYHTIEDISSLINIYQYELPNNAYKIIELIESLIK